ncbi:MAG: hypothetical protein SGPRY_002476, partial [Prymnesium sp.]
MEGPPLSTSTGCHAPQSLVYGAGDCREADYCNAPRNGKCVFGLCKCHLGFVNSNCSQSTSCRFWDEIGQVWSTEGLTVVEGPAGSGVMYCETSHLTDFGVVSIPTSLDDLLAEITSISFNFISLDDVAAMLTNFNIGENIAIVIVVFTVALVDAVLVCILGVYKGHRLRLRRLRQQKLHYAEAKQQERTNLKEKLEAYLAKPTAKPPVERGKWRAGLDITPRLGTILSPRGQRPKSAETAQEGPECSPARSRSARVEACNSLSPRGEEGGRRGRLSKRSRVEPAMVVPPPLPIGFAQPVDAGPTSAVDTPGVSSVTLLSPVMLPPPTHPPSPSLKSLSKRAATSSSAKGVCAHSSHNLSMPTSPDKLPQSESRLEDRNRNVAQSEPELGMKSAPTELQLEDKKMVHRQPELGTKSAPMEPQLEDKEWAHSEPEVEIKPAPPDVLLEARDAPTDGQLEMKPSPRDQAQLVVPVDVSGILDLGPTQERIISECWPPQPAHEESPAVKEEEERAEYTSKKKRRKQRLEARKSNMTRRTKGLRNLHQKTILYQVCLRVRWLFQDVCSVCREEHTMVSMIAPTGENDDLTPAQTIQLFFNAVMLELVLICVFFQPPAGSTDAQTGGRRSYSVGTEGTNTGVDFSFQTIPLVSTAITGFIAACVTMFVVFVCDKVFKFGNSRMRRRRSALMRMLGGIRSKL